MKSVNDIHDLIQNANTSLEPEFPGAVLDICAALLEHVSTLHADVLDCDKRLGALMPKPTARLAYDNSKATLRRYRLIDAVHPETVVRWFLDTHHYWFDGTLGENLFTGMRDDAFRYLCGWIETGELPPSNTVLEIHVEMKFDEWLKSSWKLITAKCLAVRDGVDFAVAARCTFDAGHDGLHSWAKCPNCSGTAGHPGRPCTMTIPTGTDYSKPHKFELDKDHGTYRVCKCGLSEGNAIHI